MIIINYIQKSHVSNSFDIEEIMSLLKKNSGDLIIVFHDYNLSNGSLGLCMPRSLKEYNDVRIFNEYLDEKWDCGIAISKKICEIATEYPAFFSFILGHELAHAVICSNNLDLHIHYCLIQDYISEASDFKYTKYHELPHEILFDKFGLYIAEELYGKAQIKNEILELIDKDFFKNSISFKILLDYKSKSTLEGLKEELVNFSKPYRETLIDLCCNIKRTRKKGECPLLVDMIDNFETIFDGKYV